MGVRQSVYFGPIGPVGRLVALLALACMVVGCNAGSKEGEAAQGFGMPSVAVFYGHDLPWQQLASYDVVVVEPSHDNIDPSDKRYDPGQLFAYVSVGEVNRYRPYYQEINPNWFLGTNPAWGTYVIDQSVPRWPEFFAEHVIKPLWEKGYRGFFLDTLDSWKLYANTPREKQQQKNGVVAVIKTIKSRWPNARLILNGGFEILSRVADETWMIATEGLYRQYDPHNNSYEKVPPKVRHWEMLALQPVTRTYGIPILVIDYVRAARDRLALQTARKIVEQGYIPWVTTAHLDTMGVGLEALSP